MKTTKTRTAKIKRQQDNTIYPAVLHRDKEEWKIFTDVTCKGGNDKETAS